MRKKNRIENKLFPREIKKIQNFFFLGIVNNFLIPRILTQTMRAERLESFLFTSYLIYIFQQLSCGVL